MSVIVTEVTHEATAAGVGENAGSSTGSTGVGGIGGVGGGGGGGGGRGDGNGWGWMRTLLRTTERQLHSAQTLLGPVGLAIAVGFATLLIIALFTNACASSASARSRKTQRRRRAKDVAVFGDGGSDDAADCGDGEASPDTVRSELAAMLNCQVGMHPFASSYSSSSSSK